MEPIIPTPAPPAPTSPASGAPAAPQEIDVWWGGYAGRTMLPSFLVCLVLTAGVVGIASYLGIEHILAPSVARWLVYGLTAGLWLVQVLRWAYRLAGYNYRLTTRRVFCEQGFFAGPPAAVELAHIGEVTIEQTAWERRLSVGRIVIKGNPPQPPLVLAGVYAPQVIAAEIEMYARQARQKD